MAKSKHLCLIALLPPQEVQQFANEIKQHFAEVYNSHHAQKSPPHVTLQPPFHWQQEDSPTLEQKLSHFAKAQSPVPMTLSGFGAFAPRVIYINVLKTPQLLAMQKQLMTELEESLGIVHPASKNRPFSPHLTVAFRDLTKPNFRAAWQKFQQRSLYFEFTVSQLTLLIHNGKQWEIGNEFSFEGEG